VKPGLYAMQVRALVEAAVERLAKTGKPVVEIMIPLTISREEMAMAREWVEEAIAKATEGTKNASKLDISIGTMIEVPRAAIRAEGLAEFAEFFSFGTNDLTQMTLGFSRDDIEGRIMTSYVEQGLLRTNPFETIDHLGVGELVKLAVERGRQTRPDIKLGVCGEHGGDPQSIYFFYEAGLDYVSCSPYRIPVARLAAAQAVLGAHIEGTA
jgi:pyruvate,orthophosphate dikinase